VSSSGDGPPSSARFLKPSRGPAPQASCSRQTDGFGFSRRRRLLQNLPIPKTVDQVIVHHSNRLHVSINDRRPDEAKPAALEILAERCGFGRRRRNLSSRFPPVEHRPSADELPAVGVERAELLPNREKGARIAHRGFDLHSVSNDLRIRQEPQNLFIGVARDFCGIEFVERPTIARSFFQNQGPIQSSLSA